MAQKDLKYGGAAIGRILDKLEQPRELENLYAEALLAQAVRNAQQRPTPQAPMAAANMIVDESTILPLTGGIPAAEVAIGSEFGSQVYPQFQAPPNPKGYWLYPAATDTKVLAEADEGLEELLQAAIDDRLI